MNDFRLEQCAAVIATLALICAAGNCVGDEPDFRDELPRIKPLSPAEALKSFELVEGYRIELAAAEPVVVDPVAMAFDARGRLFVIEMRGYSEDAGENLGRVRLLTDTNGDGRFDKSVVFLDGLSWPTAVTCFDGGVFVAAAPDILYCKDVDADGVADIRRRIFTGFGRGNVQGLVNTLKWGPDHRIHGATSSAGGMVKRTYAAKAEAIQLRGRDFSFDPRKLDLRPESGGGQHGMSFDDWGRKFVSSNSDHLQAVRYEDRYAARNPYLAAPPSRTSIAVDGPQAPVFRISPVEPWRIVRTRLRVAGQVPGPVEGGGKAAGYFTGATGVTIIRGDALGEGFTGLAVIGDVGSNIVHRKRITPRDAGFVADRIDEKKEFLASSDIWFRPVQFANGPDGALYIADMYREVVEHPKSLPPVIKKHLDLTSGRDRGRIYRLVADDFQRPEDVLLADLSTTELVAAIDSASGWRRTTASRLLYERQDLDAARPLRKLAASARLPESRAAALMALQGLDELDEQALLTGLADASPRVREAAIRLCEPVATNWPSLRKKLYSMTGDADPHLRYQLAFSLGEMDESLNAEGRLDALARLLLQDGLDPYARFAALSSLRSDHQELQVLLAGDKPVKNSKLLEVVGRDLNKLIEAKQRLGDKIEPPRVTAATTTRTEEAIAARAAVIQRYRPALRQQGDRRRGLQVFTKHCAACHQSGDVGKAIGPNLAAMRNRGAEAILVAVLDPNREVNPQYLGYQIETHRGRTHEGMILSESATSLTLLRTDGTSLELLRGDLAEIRQSSQSFMPQGLEKSVSIEEMEDLLSYLMEAKP